MHLILVSQIIISWMRETVKMRIINVPYVVWIFLVLVLIFSGFTLSKKMPLQVGLPIIVLLIAAPLTYYQLLRRNLALEIRDIKISKENWHGSVGYRIVADVVCKDQTVRDLSPSVNVRNYGELVPLVTLTYNKGKGREVMSPAIIKWRNVAYAWSKTVEERDTRKGKWKELRKGEELHLIFPDPAGDGFAIGDSLHWEKQFLKLEPGEKYQVIVEIEGVDLQDKLVRAKKKMMVTA